MSKKVCIIEGNTEVSYTQLWDNIELLGDAFLKIGIKENDRVVIYLPNCKEFIYTFYALARISAVSVPLNIALTSHELCKIFTDCSPRAIVTTSILFDKKISPVINKEQSVIIIDDAESKNKSINTFRELFSIGKPGNLPNISTNNRHLATINYTYRGLGKPLGAMLTHGNYHYGAMAYVRLTELVTSQRVLLITPMSHIFTLISCVIVSLLRGASIVIMKSFIPSHIFKTIEERNIDFIIAVPTVYISLLKNFDNTKYNISSLKYGITGGSYMGIGLHNEIKNKLGIELFQGYGLTETMPVTCNPRFNNKPDSLGVSGHNMKVRVFNGNGKDAAIGKIGEIVVGGPSVMKGYYNKETLNKVYLKDGWFYTGDLGWVDKDGYIYIDRVKKDIVKIGGNNVDLEEVKDVIKSYEGVLDAELDIKENELWGSQVVAKVKLKPRNNIDPKALKSFCIERLSSYKIPKEFITES